ncbi:MAG: glycosyltransferase family 9 protein [Desulfobacterales bacterium]|nr:glycosyltransferase family 9 protein [Desulfobacterales bacterium]
MTPEKREKVLIIKVGYSETLDPEIGNVTSYGDVLRSTVLVHLYKDAHLSWLVDEKAYPIVKHNPHIDRVLIYNLTTALQLQAEHFDTVINLEKVPGICALADSIKAWRRYGFRFDVNTGAAEAYDGTHIVMEICRSIEKKRNRRAYWQEGLYEMVGARWQGERYSLGYQPKSDVRYDVGFNYKAGNKWPLKAWPDENWKQLEARLDGHYTVSWQQGLDDMEAYFEWINACRLLVTNDSFGLHIAIALRKPVVALIGPTTYHETHLYGLGSILHPAELECEAYPCRKASCLHYDYSCISLITPQQVFREIESIFNRRSGGKEKVA